MANIDKIEFNNLTYNIADSTARSNINGILDGTTIDSFADVESALSGKEDTLTFDDTPTSASTNPVKSGGVYSGIQDVYEVNAILGAHNINPYPIGTEQTIGTDGTITNTPGMYLSPIIYVGDIGTINLIIKNRVGSVGIRIAEFDSTQTFIKRTLNTSSVDTTVILDSTTRYIRLCYENGYPTTGYEYVGLTIGSDNFDYQPYAMTNRQLTTNKSDISALGTDESGNTVASKAYAVGEHFYKDGYFCTVTSAIASGGTLTKNTNYTEGDVSDALDKKTVTVTPNNLTFNSINSVCSNGLVNINIVIDSITLGTDAATLLGSIENAYKPSVEVYTCGVTADGEPLRVAVNTSGKIYAKPYVALTSAKIGFTISYYL